MDQDTYELARVADLPDLVGAFEAAHSSDLEGGE